MYRAELQESLRSLEGVGEQIAGKLASLNLLSLCDLLNHFPRRYEDRKERIPLSAGYEEKMVNTVVTVDSHSYAGSFDRSTLIVHIHDETAEGELSCFGRNFLSRRFEIGQQYFLYGKFTLYKNRLQCSQFLFEPYGDSPQEFNQIFAVYPTTKGVNQTLFRRSVHTVLERVLPLLSEEMPPSLIEEKRLLPLADALKKIHTPTSPQEIEEARRTLIYEELFHLQFAIAKARSLRNPLPKEGDGLPQELPPKLPRKLLTLLRESLPFRLTESQQRSIDEILDDLESPKQLNRLLQGDVGSGKTLVAFSCALPLIESGSQVALMVPTELLAHQHFKNAKKLLAPLGIRLCLLTGSLKEESRNLLLKEIKGGEVQLIIGTHSLFSERVEYHRLDMAIIDEQQRFGVDQREQFFRKMHTPNLLVMSATPIPRSLTMTLFGDLELSLLDGMPEGRIPIETYLAIQGKEERVYSFVQRELERGRQAYFVFPLIGMSESSIQLRDAQSMHTFLQTKIFPQFRIGLIHSGLSDEEKEQTMENFVQRELDILVATTVVEVGVDVPNANVMVVDNAEQFGLSTLHQLRGRVGRGEYPSYAFLIAHPALSDEGKQRLKIMRSSCDGFFVSEEDLKMRGPGDLSGVQQSGFLSLMIANLIRDESVLVEAREDVKNLLEKDPLFESEEDKPFFQFFEEFAPFDANLIARH